ncbi:zinc-binding dehydrogenase [Streptomyces sp. NPDC005890]|uniref:zinc-binding dehydrogenase n=1 Tax=Streptomyces sp. NPDC005890 TaxID=3154568 RepID=UPI0033C2DBA5
MEAGRLRILVAGSHPLREAAAAHRQIMTGRTTGKIILIPANPDPVRTPPRGPIRRRASGSVPARPRAGRRPGPPRRR